MAKKKKKKAAAAAATTETATVVTVSHERVHKKINPKNIVAV